jgi:hypothetical protein
LSTCTHTRITSIYSEIYFSLRNLNENTKLFHRYANCRKNINSIWKIDKGDGTWATNFKDMDFEGVNNFSSLFKEDTHATIDRSD